MGVLTGAFLDVLTGVVVHTPHAWRSRPLSPGEARVGLRVARIEELPARGAPDDAVRALRAPWTIGPIEQIDGTRVRLHGRWASEHELRMILDP